MAKQKRIFVSGRQVETQSLSSCSSEDSRVPDTARASSGEMELVLGRQTSTAEDLAAFQAAANDGAPEDAQLAAATRAPPYNRRNLQLLGLSCNRAALLAILVVLLSSTVLFLQNQGLRNAIQENAIFDPLLQNLAELNLAQKLEGVLPQELGISLEQLLQKFPTGRPQISMPDLSFTEKLPRPGVELRDRGLTVKHPVFIMPGFVTSGLDLWETLPCAASQRRRRVWGTWDMTRSFLINKGCWLDHLRLDEVTGLDPPGVKVRASSGLEAVDYFVAGYYVWARLIESFADLGYDANNLVTEPYDWRLALPNLEKRDALFTRIKARIEILVKAHGEKVMVVSHSWGDNVFRNFMAWVSAGTPLWVEQHVAVYANIAGPTLGVAKSISSYLSGETRDTVEMGYVTSLLANMHFSRAERTRLFRSWGGGMGMLPIGGNAIWGNASWAPDDTPKLRAKNVSYGPMVTSWEIGDENVNEADRQQKKLLDTFRLSPNADPASTGPGIKPLDLEASLRLVMDEMGPLFEKNARRWSAIETREKCAAHLDGDDYHFSPLDCPLPKAPSLQMFCMYGVGNPTERAYHYQSLKTDQAFEVAKNEEGSSDPDPTELDVRHKVYADVNDASLQIDSGVLLSDGDGTVPLLSLGGLCQKHWQEARLNPSGIRVVTREYKHDPLAPSRNSPASVMSFRFQKLRNLFRGGARSADHVDILSHEDVVMDLLLMASGHAGDVQPQIHSRIQTIAAELR